MEVQRDTRKVIDLGKCKGVTLPKEYVEFHKISGKEKLDIVYNRFLIVPPPDATLEEKQRAELLLHMLEGTKK